MVAAYHRHMGQSVASIPRAVWRMVARHTNMTSQQCISFYGKCHATTCVRDSECVRAFCSDISHLPKSDEADYVSSTHKQSPWSRAEDEALRGLVKRFGADRPSSSEWQGLSSVFPGKSIKQLGIKFGLIKREMEISSRRESSSIKNMEMMSAIIVE